MPLKTKIHVQSGKMLREELKTSRNQSRARQNRSEPAQFSRHQAVSREQWETASGTSFSSPRRSSIVPLSRRFMSTWAALNISEPHTAGTVSYAESKRIHGSVSVIDFSLFELPA